MIDEILNKAKQGQELSDEEFLELIKKYNESAMKNPSHPKALYREPSALIILCANAPMAYTTSNGVKVIPIGCLRD